MDRKTSFFQYQIKQLSFNVGGDGSPGLLIAVDGLEGGSKQLGQLFLRFFQLFPKQREFDTVHGVTAIVRER